MASPVYVVVCPIVWCGYVDDDDGGLHRVCGIITFVCIYRCFSTEYCCLPCVHLEVVKGKWRKVSFCIPPI